MTTDSSSSTSTWPGSLVAAASPVALNVYEDPGPGRVRARRSCSVASWCAQSSTRAPRSCNNAGFIGRWRLRVTRASIRIGSRGILGMAARGLDARWRHGWSRGLRAHVSAGPSARAAFCARACFTIPRGDVRPVPPGRSREPAVAG
jgi:hypothetical protein